MLLEPTYTTLKLSGALLILPICRGAELCPTFPANKPSNDAVPASLLFPRPLESDRPIEPSTSLPRAHHAPIPIIAKAFYAFVFALRPAHSPSALCSAIATESNSHSILHLSSACSQLRELSRKLAPFLLHCTLNPGAFCVPPIEHHATCSLVI